MSAVMTLLISEIEVGPHHRAVNADAVSRIASSVEQIGLQHPVTVQNSGGVYRLIAGRHRLEAFRALGKDRIPATVAKMTDADARMWEIAENLHRAELTALERSEQIAEYANLAKSKRDLISPQLEAKIGRGRPEGGTKLAARDLGMDDEAVRRAEKIASIEPSAKAAAIEAGLADNQSKLLKVAAAPKEQQPEIVRRLAAAPKPPKVAADPLTDELAAEKQVARLMDAWNAAGPDARAEFLLRIEQPVMDRRHA